MISFEIASWEVGEKIEQTNIHTYKQTKMTEGQLRGFIYRYSPNFITNILRSKICPLNGV